MKDLKKIYSDKLFLKTIYIFEYNVKAIRNVLEDLYSYKKSLNLLKMMIIFGFKKKY
jgi:hypothetical protein